MKRGEEEGNTRVWHKPRYRKKRRAQQQQENFEVKRRRRI
jgi:hypothetical protein